MATKITKRTVDAATPRAADYLIWDSELKGFGLKVWASGSKTYFFNYRTAEGRMRRVTIGRHGDLTPQEARDQAEAHRHDVKVSGADPLGARQALRNSLTVSGMLDAYIASENFRAKSLTSQEYDRGRIENHLRPLLGKRHCHLVTRADVQAAFAAIRDGKTARDVKTGNKRGRSRVRGGEGAAKMALMLLGIAFNWAMAEGMVKENPCKFVKLSGFKTRDTIISDRADYGRLFATLDKMERERRLRSPIADAIRLIAMSGARRGEIAGLRWRHVDLKAGVITLPPAEHKAGKRTGKPRVIGLAAATQAIIARQDEGGADDFVFAPAKGDGGQADLTHAWAKVRAEAELPAGLTLHGLRHSVASNMALAGAEAAQIMLTLGHHQLSTAQRYIHARESAHRDLAEQAARFAVAGMAEASGKKAGKVVKLRGA